MYCDKCKLNYPNNIKKCPKCKKGLIENIELNEPITMHKRRDKKTKIEKFSSIKRVNKINSLCLLWTISLDIYLVLECILREKIHNYSHTFVRYYPAYISLLVTLLMVRRTESEYPVFKKTLFNNIIFIMVMVIFSIVGTRYISNPMMEGFFYGTYLYKEYWTLYIIYNIITIILGSMYLLDEDCYLSYKLNKRNDNAFKYIIVINVILILILRLLISIFI